MNCTDQLVEDHKVILRALDVLGRMAERTRNEQPVEARDIETLLRFLRTFADDYHQAKEESALFPELLNTALATRGPLRQMIFEHDQERSLVEGLEEALHTKKGMEFVYYAHRLIDLIRSHIIKEDSILFAIVEGVLSADQDQRVTAELSRFQIEPSLMTDLQRLESAYLRRVA